MMQSDWKTPWGSEWGMGWWAETHVETCWNHHPPSRRLFLNSQSGDVKPPEAPEAGGLSGEQASALRAAQHRQTKIADVDIRWSSQRIQQPPVLTVTSCSKGYIKHPPFYSWLVVWLPFFIFPEILGMSNHPNWRTLTNSYFSEGLGSNHQPVIVLSPTSTMVSRHGDDLEEALESSLQRLGTSFIAAWRNCETCGSHIFSCGGFLKWRYPNIDGL